MADEQNRHVLADLGNVLRDARRRFALTQAQLSKRVGISRDTLSRLENGGSVETEIVQRVADAIGCRLTLEPRVIRAADMRRRFAHIHAEGDDRRRRRRMIDFSARVRHLVVKIDTRAGGDLRRAPAAQRSGQAGRACWSMYCLMTDSATRSCR